MTANPKPDAVTADHLRKLAALARPCDCAHGCSHDLAYAEIDNMGGWKAIAMGLLDEADELRADLRSIRALTPPDITAAAARVLIPVFEGKHRDYMLSKGRNPDDYSSKFSMAAIAIRALAEVKP